MLQLDLLATSTFGLESVVVRELRGLGYEGEVDYPGRILFQGDPAAMARANLWLRCSDRILLRVGTVEARDFGAHLDRTFELPLEMSKPNSGTASDRSMTGGITLGERDLIATFGKNHDTTRYADIYTAADCR